MAAKTSALGSTSTKSRRLGSRFSSSLALCPISPTSRSWAARPDSSTARRVHETMSSDVNRSASASRVPDGSKVFHRPRCNRPSVSGAWYVCRDLSALSVFAGRRLSVMNTRPMLVMRPRMPKLSGRGCVIRSICSRDPEFPSRWRRRPVSGRPPTVRGSPSRRGSRPAGRAVEEKRRLGCRGCRGS